MMTEAMPLWVEQREEVAVFTELAVEWRGLLRRSAVDTIFLTPEFQRVWWEHFGHEGQLLMLLARDPAGTLQGIAPLFASTEAGQRLLRFVGGVDVSDYLDLIVARGHEEAVYRAFMQYLCTEAPPWDVLDLHCLPDHSPTRSGLLCQVCRECCPEGVEALPEQPAPYIPLPGKWEAYLDALDKKQRHELRRKLRRAQGEALLRWERLSDPAGLEEAVETFIALHRASHPEKEAFMTDAMAAFFRDLARALFPMGWLALYTLWLDERPAASLWCFDYGADLLVYNSGFDPRFRPELSPGIVLMALCIQDAIARGKARFDLMRGGENYKYRFGAREGTVYRLTVRCPRVAGTRAMPSA
jgi:CelD/BcsL family acetyltransferase involved in cellulose biosynthesis